MQRQTTAGCHLKIEFGTVEPAEMKVMEAVEHKKNGWLPLLVVLFLVSYGLMTMLIVEQGRTIDSQRVLIRELFRDSSELAAARTKGQASQTQASAGSPLSQSPSLAAPSVAPSTQAKSHHVPSKQIPSSQAGTRNTIQSQTVKPKSQVQVPARPASDIADSGRSLITI